MKNKGAPKYRLHLPRKIPKPMMLSQMKSHHYIVTIRRVARVFSMRLFFGEQRAAFSGTAIAWMLLATAIFSYSAGCQSQQKAAAPVQATVHPSVVLAAGDIVRITFPGAPELNQAQKIRPDGKIGLPLVGEVDATGKSLSALQDDLARLYKSKLQNPTVVLSLELTSAAIYISGAVNKPGKIMLERPMTALEAIMEAGGFTAGLANPKKVILVRQEGGQHRTQVLDLSPALRNESTGAIYLKPYDVLVIQERMF